MKRTLFLFILLFAFVVFYAVGVAEEQEKQQRGFPFDIFEGALGITTSLIILPLDLAYKAVPLTGGSDPYWRHARPGMDDEIKREYQQLNWYDDIRKGYSEAHQWKEADEELYRQTYGPRR